MASLRRCSMWVLLKSMRRYLSKRPGPATLIANVRARLSAPVIFQLQPIGPGVWTLPGSTTTLAVNDSNGTLVGPTNAVAPGAYVTFFLTGQGALNNPVATGGPAPPDPWQHRLLRLQQPWAELPPA